MLKSKRSYFRPIARIPRSYGIREVCQLCGFKDAAGFHGAGLSKFVRRYAYARFPRYDADDVEELARRLAYLRQLILQHRLHPKESVSRSLVRWEPPQGFALDADLLARVREQAIPPSYTIEGVVKLLGYADRSPLHRSGLLALLRKYETPYRVLYDADDVEKLARAFHEFMSKIPAMERADSEARRAYIARRMTNRVAV